MNYNLKQLYVMQKQLDIVIHLQHDKTYQNTFKERILALLVEVGELANETRCFKYWSLKGPSAPEIIVEEYSDGIHFLLSLGISIGINNESFFTPFKIVGDLTNAFVHLFALINTFGITPNRENYVEMMDYYLGLGLLLNIDEQDLIEAYIEKNKVNYERQRTNY